MKADDEDRVTHILKCLEKETSKSCIMTSRRQLDWERSSVVEYDDDEKKIFTKKSAETNPPGQTRDLSPVAEKWQRLQTEQGIESPLRYFLDGSRRTYKVADIPIGNRLFPLVGGQVGVGVCKRDDRQIRPYGQFRMHYVLAVPIGLDSMGKGKGHNIAFCEKLRDSINSNNPRLRLDDILCYSADKKDNAEDKGIEQIQFYMMAREKDMVRQLVADKKLKDDSWLVKDGSLEYAKVDVSDPLHYAQVKYNYKHVIGVSKSFNPELMQLKGNKSASRVLAELKPFHRTPAFQYSSGMVDGLFAIWYIRIRPLSHINASPFDGIVKIEKLLVEKDEELYGLESELVDEISAWVINERNPVCYGKDARWANHLYPVYLTENYVKSKYMSTMCFTHLF